MLFDIILIPMGRDGRRQDNVVEALKAYLKVL